MLRSLKIWWECNPLSLPADMRCCFRECTLAIGLSAVAADVSFWHYQHVVESIRYFWSQHENRRSPRYQGDRNLNDVLLSCLLLPQGVIQLRGEMDWNCGHRRR